MRTLEEHAKRAVRAACRLLRIPIPTPPAGAPVYFTGKPGRVWVIETDEDLERYWAETQKPGT